MAKTRIVLSFTVAILISSSALVLRAQTNLTNTPSSQPDAVKAAAPPTTSSDEFVIGPGDVLAINVWKETDISKVIPVRSDGRISLPLIGELKARGLTPKQLEADTKRLKDYVADPSVTVVVQEIKSQKINVLGMVARPGSYAITNSLT